MSNEKLRILKNTIEQMACDADDKGLADFGLRLSVADAFALCKLEPPRRWIPCSERMPETDGPYLVVNKVTGWIWVCNFSRVKNFPYFGPQENAWWRLDDDWYPQSCNVTHWMPLPEPPEEVLP